MDSPAISDELRAVLVARKACDPDLAKRVGVLAGPLRARRFEVEGCPVLFAGERPFAAAHGVTTLLVCVEPPAVLEARPVAELPGWFEVDAWPADVAFARGTDSLRRLLAAAHARAADDTVPPQR